MSFKLKHAYTTSSRVQAVQAATAVCYGLGALCWITNATWSGWPSENSSLDSYLTGTTAVVGALLFHLGAFCQVCTDAVCLQLLCVGACALQG